MDFHLAETLQLFAVFGCFLGIAVCVTVYRLKLARIHSGSGPGGAQQIEAIEALRKEVTELRNTTTAYDVSIDSALQRIEARVSSVETKVRQIEGAAEAPVQQRVV